MDRNYLSYLVIFLCVVINCVLCTVVSWGGHCNHTAECGDHRLVCENVTIENLTTQRCICDRYHRWNGTLVGCVQKYTSADILGMLNEKYNIAERIEYEANIVFLAQIIAGLLVMGIGFTCAISVAIYCCRMWKQDSDLDELVARMESQKNNTKAGTSKAKT